MNVRWDVFPCTLCPPDINKKWDIALLAEHHAIAHMDNFHLFECPSCHKKQATPLAAQFHLRKCLGNTQAQVSDYARNLLTVNPKLFIDLHSAQISAIKAFMGQKVASSDAQTQTDGVSTAEPEPDALNTVIALLGGKAESVGNSNSKEKMTEMWNNFTTAPAEKDIQAEDTGEDEYEEIAHDETLNSSVAGDSDAVPSATPEPAALPVPPHTPPVSSVATPTSSDFRAPTAIPNGIVRSPPKSIVSTTSVDSYSGRVRSVMPRLSEHSNTQRHEENSNHRASVAREEAVAQRLLISPSNLMDPIDHFHAKTNISTRLSGGTDSTDHPKNALGPGASSLQHPDLIPKKPSILPVPSETFQPRHSIADVQPPIVPVEAIPLPDGAKWRFLPMERSSIWKTRDRSTFKFNGSDEHIFHTTQMKRGNSGDIAEFKIPFKKPFLSDERAPLPPEQNNGFRHPFPVIPGVMDPRRRPISTRELSIPPRAETSIPRRAETRNSFVRESSDRNRSDSREFSREPSIPPRAETRASYIRRAETRDYSVRESPFPSRADTRESSRSSASSEFRAPFPPPSSHVRSSQSAHLNPVLRPASSGGPYPARAQSVMSHLREPRQQQPEMHQRGGLTFYREASYAQRQAPDVQGQAAGSNHFINPPNLVDLNRRRAATRLPRRTEFDQDDFFLETPKTDVTVTIFNQQNQSEMRMYFKSKYLTLFSSVFRQKFSQWQTPGMKVLQLNNEHGLAFFYAMCAFHQKAMPVTPICDLTGQFTIFRGDILCMACDIVERYDLQGAMEVIAKVVFTTHCHRGAPQNRCPSCIDRVAIALRYKMKIPAALKFTDEAVAVWLAFPPNKTLATRLGNVHAVSDYLKAEIHSIVNK